MIRHPIEYIEHLQQKPESTRKMILVFSVSTIMLVLIAIWFSTFSFQPMSAETASVANTDAPNSPFAITWNLIKNIWK